MTVINQLTSSVIQQEKSAFTQKKTYTERLTKLLHLLLLRQLRDPKIVNFVQDSPRSSPDSKGHLTSDISIEYIWPMESQPPPPRLQPQLCQ